MFRKSAIFCGRGVDVIGCGGKGKRAGLGETWWVDESYIGLTFDGGS